MPEFECKATERKDRTKVALQMKNVGENDLKALTFVENLKKQHGLVWAHWKLPLPSTHRKWAVGCLLHVQGVGKFEGSASNVVYNSKTKDGEDRGWMLALSNNRVASKNSVYPESRLAEHCVSDVGWIPIIYDGLNQNRIYKSETWGGCMSTISIGTGTSPVVEAILTLEDA
ncbi:unnamed protein product [Prunus armeniaca]|uniref:Uncharacterized protein n=1 Tax=Prunus armeniaca TaxID=36596 RepID=A0A6J5TZR9_PRUAR|nr:unnamed protein product [Prunus armeniaca]